MYASIVDVSSAENASVLGVMMDPPASILQSLTHNQNAEYGLLCIYVPGLWLRMAGDWHDHSFMTYHFQKEVTSGLFFFFYHGVLTCNLCWIKIFFFFIIPFLGKQKKDMQNI